MPLLSSESTLMHAGQVVDSVYHRGEQIYSSAPSASATMAWGLSGTVPPSPAKTITGLGGTIVDGVLLVPEDTLENDGIYHPNVAAGLPFPTLVVGSTALTLAKGSGNGARRLFLSPSSNGFRLFTQNALNSGIISVLNSEQPFIYITNYPELSPENSTDYNFANAFIGLSSKNNVETNVAGYYIAGQAYGYMGIPRTLEEWQQAVDSDPSWSRTEGEITGQNRRIEVITNQAGQITRILYSGIGV